MTENQGLTKSMIKTSSLKNFTFWTKNKHKNKYANHVTKKEKTKPHKNNYILKPQ